MLPSMRYIRVLLQGLVFVTAMISILRFRVQKYNHLAISVTAVICPVRVHIAIYPCAVQFASCVGTAAPEV